MPNNTFVSVIVPCYNYGQFIRETIESVERCDSQLYELIIVDDGSTDPHTQKVLKELESEGYNVIRQENKGVAAARNNGIAAAQGKYILALDSDDQIYPNYLQLAVNAMEKQPDVGVVFGKAEFFGEKEGEWELPDFAIEKLLLSNFIYVSAVYRRDIWAECGGYDENRDIDGWEDWDFWLSVAEKEWRFIQLSELIFRYRIHDLSKLATFRSTGEPPAKADKYILSKHSQLYRKHLKIMYEESALLRHWKNNQFRGMAKLFISKLMPNKIKKVENK